MSAARTATAKPPRTARSAVANGSRLWVEQLDGRSAEARRFRDLVGDLVEHLGGELTVTAPQLAIVRRAAALATWAEKCEAALVAGTDFDAAAYATVANSLRRLLQDLGLQRAMRDVTPTLAEYLVQKAATEAAEAREAERRTVEPSEPVALYEAGNGPGGHAAEDGRLVGASRCDP